MLVCFAGTYNIQLEEISNCIYTKHPNITELLQNNKINFLDPVTSRVNHKNEFTMLL